jgi:hypothetical protein
MKALAFFLDLNCQIAGCEGTQIEVLHLGPENEYFGHCVTCGKTVSGSLILRADIIEQARLR